MLRTIRLRISLSKLKDVSMCKYIFITGGVCSSLGKGVTTAALGCLLESRGFRVGLLKMDPYINVDPGTMSPFQHGEVFVTSDGAETDLDLGYYERFTANVELSQKNSVSAGQIYHTVIERERKGGYLGRTVQVIPHITNEIQDRIDRVHRNKGLDFVIVEIGGTVGDIESIPFLEAIRQVHWKKPKSVCFIHLTLIPTIEVSGELKTKPTQHSVKELLTFGIQTDLLVCRVKTPLSEAMKEKMALFCNVNYQNIISASDIRQSIYEIPSMYHKEKLDEKVLSHFSISTEDFDFSVWNKIIHQIRYPKQRVKIAVCGKYISLKDAYRSVYEAITHGGIANGAEIDFVLLDSEEVSAREIEKDLRDVDGLLVPGGFGNRGISGKIRVIEYARQKKIPFLGICLGMQCVIIEFARNVLGHSNANSDEFNEKTDYPVISLLEGQIGSERKGGTMRLGSYPCIVAKNTLLYETYQKEEISERHRHRFEFTLRFKDIFEKEGMIFSGMSPNKNLVEAIELKDHPWFIAVQFHPEFQSKPTIVHPLFQGFIAAALKNKFNKGQRKSGRSTKIEQSAF